MKYFKLFEQHDPVTAAAEMIRSLRTAGDVDEVLLRAYVEWNFEEDPNDPYTDVDDVFRNIKYALETLTAQGDTVTLYRLVLLDKEEDLNRDVVGNHYVLSKRHFTQEMISSVDAFYLTSGKRMYILTCQVRKSDIDLNKTIDAHIEYPLEKEIYVRDGAHVDVVVVQPYHPDIIYSKD